MHDQDFSKLICRYIPLQYVRFSTCNYEVSQNQWDLQLYESEAKLM